MYTTGIVHTILLERFGESNATTAWAASLFSALSSLAGKVSSFGGHSLVCLSGY